MIYSHEVQHMCCKEELNSPVLHDSEEGKSVRATQITDISGLTHGIEAGAHRNKVDVS